MKKLFLTLLVITAGIVNANADNITRRIWAYCDWGGEWQSTNNSIRIHYYKSDGTDITSWDASATQYMTRFNSTNWFFYDITADENDLSSVKVIIRANSGDNQTTPYNNDEENMDLVNKSYQLTVQYKDNVNRAIVSELKYYLINMSDNNSLTEMETSDCCIYKALIDNQTNTGSSYYAVAPSFAISNGAVSAWGLVFRPWQEHQNLTFENVSDRPFFAEDNNSNSWCSNNVAAKFVLSMNTLTWKYDVNPYIEKTIGAHEYSSFSSDYAFATPEGVTAYYASAASSKSVTLSPVTNGVPACQGVILNGTANETVKLTPATTTDDLSNNKLVAVKNGAAIPASTEGSFTYVFAYQNDDLGFFKLTSSVNATADMAYLQTSEDISGAKVVFGFDEDATGIESIENAKSDNAIYNLNGVRVDNPTKGIFIQNGKKVIIK